MIYVLILFLFLIVYVIQSRFFKMEIFLDIVAGAFLSFNAAISVFGRFLAKRLC